MSLTTAFVKSMVSTKQYFCSRHSSLGTHSRMINASQAERVLPRTHLWEPVPGRFSETLTCSCPDQRLQKPQNHKLRRQDQYIPDAEMQSSGLSAAVLQTHSSARSSLGAECLCPHLPLVEGCWCLRAAHTSKLWNQINTI